MNKFYVYVYLNPTKPGNFNYGQYHFEYEPFYIGKGKDGRMYKHLQIVDKNRLKNNKLKKILKSISIEDFKSKYIIVQRSELPEICSFALEIDMIQTIGRRDLKLGPLCNLTDGGEGISGYIHKNYKPPMLNKHHSEETKLKISKANKDRIVSEETKKKIGLANSGKSPSKDVRNKMSKAHEGKKFTKKHKKNISKSAKIRSEKINYFGKNNPNAKAIVIDGIKYNTKTEAQLKLNLSYREIERYLVEG